MTQAVSIRSISVDALKCSGGSTVPERKREIKPIAWAADAATIERIHDLGRDVVALHCDYAMLSKEEIKRILRQFAAEAVAILPHLTSKRDRRRMTEAVHMRFKVAHNCFDRVTADFNLRMLVDVACYLAPLSSGEA